MQAANAATAHNKSGSVCVFVSLNQAGFESFGILCPSVYFLDSRACMTLRNQTVCTLRGKIRIITGAVGKRERIKKRSSRDLLAQSNRHCKQQKI